MLESGSEGVAEELATLIKQEGFTGIEDGTSRSQAGLLLQFGSQVEGQLGNLTLQRRLGQHWRFRHFSSSCSLGYFASLLPHLRFECQVRLTHPINQGNRTLIEGSSGKELLKVSGVPAGS
jgi:hypothetical protein